MKARNTLIPAVCLAVLALAVAGCSKGGGGSSGGSGSRSSSSSGASPTTSPGSSPSVPGGAGQTEAVSPPSPDLGYTYHTAVLAYYYFYHKKSTVVWGDVGSYWGHYDQDDYSMVLDDGYGAEWPTFTNATQFGSFYSSSILPPPPAAGIPYHDPHPVPPLAPDGLLTYFDMIEDAKAAFNAMGDTGDYPTTDSYTGTGPGRTYTCRHHSVSESHYIQDLAGMTFTTGTYDFASDVRLQGTTTSPGILTIDGSPTDIFVFRIHGNLWVRGNTKVVFTGGARPENVYWRVEVADPYGYYVGYDPGTGTYMYEDIPGAYIGDDKDFPPYRDPKINGYSSFAGNILCKGDIAVGGGSSHTGRLLSIDYGWWLYAVAVYGAVSIQATQPLAMGTANDFAVLADVDITNTGETAIKGKVGAATGAVMPKTGPDAIEVDPPSDWLPDGAPAAVTAISSAATAALDALSRDLDYDLTGEQLMGKQLPPGVYLIDDMAWDGDPKTDGPVTLDGLNDPASVWIFRFPAAMDVSSTAGVIQFTYKNGADPDNVFWLCSTAHLAAGLSMRGTILASSSSSTAIVLDTDAVVQGRLISANGSIVLNSNTVFSNSSGGLLSWTSPSVRQSNPVASRNDEARSVVNDGTYMYVFGFAGDALSATNTLWRIEKRMLTDGSLVPAFGTGGAVTWDISAGLEIPRRILIDGSGIYVFGSTETGSGSGVFQWRLEKRSLSTGSLLAAFDGDGVLTWSLPTGGVAGDMALYGSELYLVGEQNDYVSPTLSHQRVRIEKRDTTSGVLISTEPLFSTPDTWRVLDVDGDIIGFTTVDPAPPSPPDYPATPAGVIVEYTMNLGSLGQSRGARCLTLVPSPSAGDPFMILGGWEDLGHDPFSGWGQWGFTQKRFLSDGTLDAADYFSFPIHPGYGTLSSGNGTQDCPIAISPTAFMTVESIVNDGTYSYSLLSVDYGGYAGLPSGIYHWVLEKRELFAFAGTPPDYTDPITGGDDVATMYNLGIYGPVPKTPSSLNFGCNMLGIDGKRLFAVGCDTGALGGEMWHIEKRKTSTLFLDALFNTNGVRPGIVDSDPEPGAVAVPEEWYIYDYGTYSYYWTNINPVTDGDADTIWVAGTPPDGWGWTPVSAYYHAGIPAVPGRPDRCFGVTTDAERIYIVGSDSGDTPDHAGQWRIEARNK